MDIQNEINSLSGDYETLKKQLDPDTQRKIGSILNILEIGTPSVAHSKMVLHICEDILDKCSTTLMTKTDV